MLRAVLAEDIVYVRQLLKAYCEESGIEVVAETGMGTEVLALIQEHRPNLITLDIELEDLTGIEVAKQIRTQLDYEPYIIFVTGSTDPMNIMTAVNEINAFYVVKPLQRERWQLAVDKILEINGRQLQQNRSESASTRLIQVQTSRKIYPITEESILMVEKENNKKNINIYLTNGEVLSSNSTIHQIKNQTTELIYESIRGFLVNIRHVSGVTKEVLLHDNSQRRFTIYFKGTTRTAPLGRYQEKEFIEQFNRLNNR
ncbi:LytR/AlgR family response regulator transcription factor [Cohnella cellulosilytica]|uniref:LytR/AlgR family response regulator transcription factor n=1 Tax=Cohnella cellulosilytica TaxID=986710 RepID=A0ABW2F5Y9_9BACL